MTTEQTHILLRCSYCLESSFLRECECIFRKEEEADTYSSIAARFRGFKTASGCHRRVLHSLENREFKGQKTVVVATLI